MYRPFIHKTVKSILIPTLLIGGLSACGYSKTEMNKGAKTQSAQSPNTKDGTKTLGTNQPDRTLALRTKDITDDVPGVARATAYAYGKDIVVGVEPKTGTDPKTLQQNVYSTLQKREPGYNIHVTTDNKIHSRIQTLANNTTHNTATTGHPVRDLGKDVGDIVRDIGRTVTAPLRK
ncbi:MAG TPA: YhcN/YlaJ family sporulation lipoprotein [Bacillota bacterium]|nr:YhcN/YlaJ family sporulation lipoprotein [Bacillota bacterium]